ncbi:MAG: N-methylproline demethylase, partial [Verrucomicrobiaceae bacterium]|nr:N-methylproline demethylase [Verrucomicrobiaceae bacterium]
QITTMTRVRALAREGNKIKATLWSPYTEADCGERIVDQVVQENGTAPLDDLYFDLKEHSINRGEIDHLALLEGRKQEICVNPQGRFQLFRIGDAVASRNVHAAIYEALRLAKDF